MRRSSVPCSTSVFEAMICRRTSRVEAHGELVPACETALTRGRLWQAEGICGLSIQPEQRRKRLRVKEKRLIGTGDSFSSDR